MVVHLVEVVHPDLSVDEDSIFAGRNFILSIRNRNSLSLRVPQGAIFLARWFVATHQHGDIHVVVQARCQHGLIDAALVAHYSSTVSPSSRRTDLAR